MASQFAASMKSCPNFDKSQMDSNLEEQAVKRKFGLGPDSSGKLGPGSVLGGEPKLG